jgi:hypothetical protein
VYIFDEVIERIFDDYFKRESVKRSLVTDKKFQSVTLKISIVKNEDKQIYNTWRFMLGIIVNENLTAYFT